MQHNKEMLQHLLRCDAVGGILRTVRHDTLVLSDYPAWSSHMEHIVKKQFPHVTVHLRSSSRSLSGFEIDFVFTSYQTQILWVVLNAFLLAFLTFLLRDYIYTLKTPGLLGQ